MVTTVISTTTQSYAASVSDKSSAKSGPSQEIRSVSDYSNVADEAFSSLKSNIRGYSAILNMSKSTRERDRRIGAEHLEGAKAHLSHAEDMFKGISVKGSPVNFNAEGHASLGDFTLSATAIDGEFSRTYQAEAYVPPGPPPPPTPQELLTSAAKATLQVMDAHLAKLARSVHDYNRLTLRLQQPADDALRQSLQQQRDQIEAEMAAMPLGSRGLSQDLADSGYSVSGDLLSKAADGTYKFGRFTLSAAGKTEDGRDITASVNVDGIAKVAMAGQAPTDLPIARDNPMTEYFASQHEQRVFVRVTV